MKKRSKAFVLISAIAAIALCVCLISGVTFALFSSDSKINITVTSATVDVTADITGIKTTSSLSDWKREGVTEAAFENGGGAVVTGKEIKLQKMAPGDSVQVTVNIANHSNINVLYSTSVYLNLNDKLSEVLELNVAGSGQVYNNLVSYTSEWKSLPASGAQAVVSITLPENAGNQYQNLSTNVALSVNAVQGNADADENNHLSYKVSNEAQFIDAMQHGGEVTLFDDIALTVTDSGEAGLLPIVTVNKDTRLNLNGKTLSIDPECVQNELACTPALISVTNGATLTIDGDGIITAAAEDNGAYCIDVYNGNLIINGGTFYGGMTAAQLTQGSLEINGGYFDMTEAAKNGTPANWAKYIINVIDRYYKDGSATVKMTGGTVVGYDPSNNPEGANTSYVADGCSVVECGELNGRTLYTVVKDGADNAVSVASGSSLMAAVNNPAFNEITLVNSVTLGEQGQPETLAVNRAMVINGNGKTVTATNYKTKENYCVVNVTASDCKVELRDISVVARDGVASYMRGINVSGTENLELVVDNVTVDLCDYYAFNITLFNHGLNITVNDSNISGWGAVKNHSSGVTFTANNSTFTGINPHASPENSGNYFTTIIPSNYVLYDSSEFVEDYLSANNTFTFNNCTIIAKVGVTADGTPVDTQQKTVDIRSPYNNTVNLNGCTLVAEGGNDKIASAYDSEYIPEANRGDETFVVDTNKVIIDGVDCTNDATVVEKYLDE